MYDANKLVAAYIKLRDAKEALAKEYDGKINDIKEQMELIEGALLDVCKTTGQDGGKTSHGSFTRSVKTRYWTTDWGSMTKFIKQHDALELFEQRIHQGNMKSFLQENPNLLPDGLNVDSKYSVTVRRASK
jgi:hypothetical protein